jgi:hypothetical protein
LSTKNSGFLVCHLLGAIGLAGVFQVDPVDHAVGGLVAVHQVQCPSKPAAFQATPQLGPEASRALLQQIGRVRLTEKRRAELSVLSAAARSAFARTLCPVANDR